MLEGSDYPSPSGLYKILTLFQDERRDDIIMMKSGYFDLYALDSVAAYESNLSILLPLLAWLSKLESN